MRFVINGIVGHDSEAALIEPRFFLHLGLNSPRITLIDITKFLLLLKLDVMIEIVLLILERLFPGEVDGRDEVIPGYLRECLRFAGYIFLLSGL